MVERTIDLRKKEAVNIATPSRAASVAVAHEEMLPTSRMAASPLFLWTAPEYEVRPHGSYWSLGMLALAVLFIIFGILTRNYFFIAFIVLAFGVLLMYQKRPPKEIFCSIHEQGIQIGQRWHPFSDLKSFWIFEVRDTRELSLEAKSAMRPFVRIPLGAAEKERVQNILERFLPEVEHQDSIADHIARAI